MRPMEHSQSKVKEKVWPLFLAVPQDLSLHPRMADEQGPGRRGGAPLQTFPFAWVQCSLGTRGDWEVTARRGKENRRQASV